MLFGSESLGEGSDNIRCSLGSGRARDRNAVGLPRELRTTPGNVYARPCQFHRWSLF